MRMGTSQFPRGKEFGVHREAQPLRFGGRMAASAGSFTGCLSRDHREPKREGSFQNAVLLLNTKTSAASGRRESNFPSTPWEPSLGSFISWRINKMFLAYLW